MIRRVAPIAGLFLCLLSACATPVPTWRAKTAELVNELAQQGARAVFPQEYSSLLETFEHGEAVLHVHEDEKEADAFYLIALQKGTVLKGELTHHNQLLAEEKRQREAREAARVAEEAARKAEERLMIQAAEAEVRLRQQEQLKADQEDKAAVAAKHEASSTAVQISVYTVRRGETLPQIAARSEIYNDASLWPLIYRSNRDQIRNPRQLWPGQVLKIPRHFSRDEAMKAKRFFGRR